MKITILGTAPPLKTLIPGQAGTSLLVEHDGRFLMADCGPGSVNRLEGLGVDIRRIETLLLTHHHWDHVADVPFFVLGRWEASQFGASGGRPFAPRLKVFGPAGTAEFLTRLFGPTGAFAGDIATRLAEDIGVPLYGTRGIKAPFPPIMPQTRELEPGAAFEADSFAIRAALALHCQPYLASIAYRIEAGGHSMVFSGDSAPSEEIAALAKGADILLHDCNMKEEVRLGLGRTALHSTGSEVGEIAARAGVKRLVLVHHGLAEDDAAGREALAGKARARYAGPVDVARTLAAFDLR